MNRPDCSRHAATRAQQRGVPARLLRALLDHHDIDTPVGRNCRLLRCSRERLADRSLHAQYGSEAERLADLAVVWSDRTGLAVTVLHLRPGRSGRRYRAAY